MPRRRRIRNQKRRTGAGDRSAPGGAAVDGPSRDGRAPSGARGVQAPRPPQGLPPRGPSTPAVLNDNLQTGVRRGGEDCGRPPRDAAAAGGRAAEANGKISRSDVPTKPNTPTVAVEPEPNLLNNMTPRRNVRHAHNDSYIDNLCTSSSTSLLRPGRPHKFRSNSSTSKLRSPGAERTPITVDAATQTVGVERPVRREESLHLESCVNIFETPRLSQAADDQLSTPNLRKRIDVDKLDFKPFNLNRIRYRKLKNFSEILFAEGEFKTLSDAEISFRNLLEVRDVSTPVERKKVENVPTPQNNRATAAEKVSEGNDRNSTVKNRSKEKVRAKKFEASLITKRRYKTISPRKNREVAIRNLSPARELKRKNDRVSIPKSFTPPRSTHCKTTENILNVSSEQGRFLARAKKFHTRFVSQWIAKISEICNWLGLSLKKTLSTPTRTLCKPNCTTWLSQPPFVPTAAATNNPPINGVVPTVCSTCEENRMKLIVLSSKVEVLERELKKSTEESQKTIADLVEVIAKVRLELGQVETIKDRVAELEQLVNSRVKQCRAENPAPPPPPPPPCAPPLPPPLPPPLINLDGDTPVARPRSGGGGTKRLERKPNENSRPVISLDDILKVKLKKTTDKPLSARRAQQPLISVEMLSQIKLRPTSRPETPCGFKEGAAAGPTLPGSPATSLSKILSNVDTNVRLIKRLRRPNRFSFDDFSRRRVSKREWSGSDDA